MSAEKAKKIYLANAGPKEDTAQISDVKSFDDDGNTIRTKGHIDIRSGMGKSFKYHDSGTEGNPLSDRMNAALESDIDNRTIGNKTEGRDKYKG